MKPLSRRQLEVLRAIRRIQATCNPMPDAAVSHGELIHVLGGSPCHLGRTLSGLMERDLICLLEASECVGPYQWTKTLYRATPAEDVG